MTRTKSPLRVFYALKTKSCVAWQGARAGCFWGFVCAVVVACAAIFPEISTPLKPIPPGAELEPAPPKDMLYIAFKSAQIPKRTRDGRRWDDVGNGAPDAEAIIYIGEDELMRTNVQSNSFNPTWPHAPKKNYEVPPGSVLRVELWEDNAVVDSPICMKNIREPYEEAALGEVTLRCDSGAEMVIELAPAKAKFGLGLYYELRTESVAVTRTLPRSPAARANLQRGDLILSIMGRPVKGMSEEELRTQINANSANGIKMRVKTKTGVKDIVLKDGPIYSLKDLE